MYTEEQRKDAWSIAIELVGSFEDLLDEKNIKIPCSDSIEENDRQGGNNDAKLYGTEYYKLVEEVQNTLLDRFYK